MKKTILLFLFGSLMAMIGSGLFVNNIRSAGYFFLGISFLFIILSVSQLLKTLFSKG